ncbi:STAS domain-containing protein [Terribacillus saccharophilus]|uniref:RsbT co-antagonist protein RsbRB n=1 Tax=Terribacillus saccharophilus TaxID=361277 RepID=A0ABX4H0F2_9BACI|nr:STAS domain-containing protein [Terribacillus saccharophilus]PAD35913.1 RsbT co-antagonist protein RsbRB [Terribacillus saccharophilus]PAD97037.1 RsbT co-antagonist protein RsbRB [Terribacillus saccharophilus]PAE00613.1 RsbT co-antagonist protein RsbRB [Terribacillus saccharophilus]
MHRNKDLYLFLEQKAKDLNEKWYEQLDKTNSSGVYASNDPETIHNLKLQNYEFHLHFFRIFIEDKEAFEKDFQEWIVATARDENHLNTPTHQIIREFMVTRGQHLDLIREFYTLHKDTIDQDMFELWNREIIKAFDDVILKFTEEMHHYSNRKLQAQQEMINELSSPVILLNDTTALLPLVGDIDTNRAKLILENTLRECTEQDVDLLFIDLSGVIIIDTMVAQQIFYLVDALKLVGVETVISGMRPEIAQTAVQLGVSFNARTTATLTQAIRTSKRISIN